MAPTPPTPRSKCERCNAWALKKPDPDGRRLCFAHSQSPEAIAKRGACGLAGAKTAATVKGLPADQRKAALAGVVNIDEARAKAAEEKRGRAQKKAEEAAEPIALKTREDVLAFIEQSAGRLFAGADAKEAQAVSALARTALAALGFTAPPEHGVDDDEVGTFTFHVLPKPKAERA